VPQDVFGYWAGLAVHDTSQVVATAAAFGPVALTVATVVKLTRNAMMLPLIVLLSAASARGEVDVTSTVRRSIPLFVLGFIGLAGLNSIGLIGSEVGSASALTARALILVALPAIGLSISVRDLVASGLRPLVLAVLVTATTGLLAALFLATIKPV
jgi:uncharacterized membrane protein YadS